MTETYFIARTDLMAIMPLHVARQFEDMQRVVADNDTVVTANVATTGALKDAAFLTLSANDELPNERVLALGPGLRFDTGTDGQVALLLDGVVQTDSEFRINLVVSGDTEVVLPLTGIVATRENAEVLRNKTLDAPGLVGLIDAADSAAAGASGVPVGGMFRTGDTLKVRTA